MSVPYHRPLRQIALRVGALRGAQVEGVESSYITQPLTKAEISENSPINFTALKDALLDAEQKLVGAIADTPNHPLARYLTSQTANIANETLIPSTDASSKNIIGIRGSVSDATDGNVCTEQDLKVIQRIVANSGSRYLIAHYHYKMDGERIYHTRTNVKIDVCTYDAATQRTAIDNNSNMLLPDTMEEALVCGGVAYLKPSEVYQDTNYGQWFQDTLNSIRQLTDSPKAIPYPTAEAA